MTYRGDDDAQRARIDQLERKLAAASDEIALLKGQAHVAAPGARLDRSRISNGPIYFEREVALPYAISELGYEAIATALRARLKLNATQVGRTLTVPNVFSLERAGEGTRIRLTGDWRGMPGGVIAVTGMVGFFSSVLAAGALADIIAHGLGWLHSFPVDAGLVALGVGATAALTAAAGMWTRRTTARTSAQYLADYEGTLAAILALAEEHAVREVAPTRVAEDVGAEAGEADASVADGSKALRR